MEMKPLPTVDAILRDFSYDPATGAFARARTTGGQLIGVEAGWTHRGYRYVKMGHERFAVARLVFKIVYGRDPKEIDHINGDKSDNAINNLREANRSQNCCNKSARIDNKAGKKGVSWHTGAWRAVIYREKKQIFLGRFATAESAHQAYVAAAQQLHGDFWRA